MQLRPRALRVLSNRYRFYSSSVRFCPVPLLESLHDEDINHLDLERPVVFRKQFKDVPAISRWFTLLESSGEAFELRSTYLKQHEDLMVPLELSSKTDSPNPLEQVKFERFEGPLGLLLHDLRRIEDADAQDMRLYLAQCPLEDLPSDLRADLPTPGFVSRIGNGDIYGSSLWMGRPPTTTPLHRDPNPNLFVQLAGKKTVRLMKPSAGRELYERTKATSGRANMRGEEMMVGQERWNLEDAVWNDENGDKTWPARGWEAQIERGDGLYIPLGYWHAVRGTGPGINVSANWWFR
ncbi:Clavaminate synthase-like protein [Aaosphaeria arxii CBS 175.79]|uniref:Clavaminate synthase-like protein n=1 Tax=Aaosphaeria arxii CBS 175.79 TaxID=1450172 RepID=A0A6A5Y0D3_9PLEO|nr:Clavaminate synthase-like protein [Aaosphaeria arxii CBS 175.79]KAF2018998.1 Clavaminate synthase-like protein [Aaosphaeria arxii CBS 175.79]